MLVFVQIIVPAVSSIDLVVLDFSICTILIFLFDVAVRAACHRIIIVDHLLVWVLVGIVQQNAASIAHNRVVFNLLPLNKSVLMFSLVLTISLVNPIFRMFKSVLGCSTLVLSRINDRHLFKIVDIWTFNQKDGGSDLENVSNAQLVQRTLLPFGAQTQPSSIS